MQYLYDGNGRRIQKIFAGTATADQDVYFNEDFQALETRWNGSTNAYEQHVWDLKYIDAPILRYRDANGHTSSTSTGDGTSEEVLYFTFDANFNITGLVQENQTFVERYVYTPYGDRLVLTGTFGSRASTNYDQQLGHQGLYTDVESGTIYNRGRQGYHPGLGNFTQRDPRLTEYQDGPNLYQGYRGNPVMGVDPSGLITGAIVDLNVQIAIYAQALNKIEEFRGYMDALKALVTISAESCPSPDSKNRFNTLKEKFESMLGEALSTVAKNDNQKSILARLGFSATIGGLATTAGGLMISGVSAGAKQIYQGDLRPKLMDLPKTKAAKIIKIGGQVFTIFGTGYDSVSAVKNVARGNYEEGLADGAMAAAGAFSLAFPPAGAAVAGAAALRLGVEYYYSKQISQANECVCQAAFDAFNLLVSKYNDDRWENFNEGVWTINYLSDPEAW